MKVQVIGGSGFIGTNLLSKLSDDTVNIDKQQSLTYPNKTKIADIREYTLLNETMVPSEWLVVLAAEHRDDVSPISLYYDVNVDGATNIIKAAEAHQITKILFTSSVAVYGLNKKNPNEEHPVDPFNHYGKSKFEAEEVFRSWYEKDPQNRTLVIVRPTVVFGPKNRGNVYNLLKQIASGKFLMIGSGENKKSMAYIENVTGFIHFLLQRNDSGYQLYNYADKPDLTTRELVNQAQTSLGAAKSPIRIPYFIGYSAGLFFDVIAKLTGKKLPVSSVRVKKFCATTQYDASKALQTGYKSPYSLNEGVDITIRSIKNGE